MLEGEISEINLVERLVELWREQFTGAIRFENDGIIKIIYFKGGDILSASTNDRSDSIDEILMRAGKVSREHVKQALAKRKENETLGDALLNLGFITRKELTWARRVQVVGVIRSIAAWTNGSFTIVADYLPKRDEGTLFPMPQVLVELIVTDQDRSVFERALDGGTVVFTKSQDFDDVFRRLGLNEDADAIATQIDGAKSAAEIASASGRDTFNAYKLLHAFATLGIVKRSQKAAVQPEFSLDDFASAGVADAADMWNEPQAPSPHMPTFELDEAEAASGPTLEIPAAALRPAEPAPAAPSAWDETEEAPMPGPPPAMPSWDTGPAKRTPVAIPTPAAARPSKADEEWGFDEAQLETAKRASVPAAPQASVSTRTATRSPLSTPKPRKPKSHFGLLMMLMIIFILAGGGYYGFLWYQKRQEPEATPAAAVVPRRTPQPAPVQPAAAAPSTATIVETTTTAPPAPAPMQVTATVAEPATTTQATPPQALPAVVPRQSGANRYEAMAREFAANPTGNFTVQIQILCETSNLDKAMRAGGNNVWFLPQAIGTRSCYRVFWGRYATREEAQRALASIPADVRDRSAAVKPIPKQ